VEVDADLRAIARLNVELELNLSDAVASTLSGLIVAALGRLPRVGDTVDLGPAAAEVLHVSDDRASRVRLRLVDEPSPEADDDVSR